jgi:hypothetical protein
MDSAMDAPVAIAHIQSEIYDERQQPLNCHPERSRGTSAKRFPLPIGRGRPEGPGEGHQISARPYDFARDLKFLFCLFS